jgi:uncharacterized delta-60 repeat protein
MRNVKRRGFLTILALLVGCIAIIPSIGGATPQKCYVFTTNYNNGSISIIDPIAYAVETSITSAAGQPSGLSLSPDGETLYVAERSGNHVEIFDVASKTSSGTIPTGSTTNDVLVSPNGGIAAAVKTDWGASTIEIIDLTTNTVTGSVPIPVDARSAAFTPDGSQVWVNSIDSGIVGVVDVAAETSSSFSITHSNPGGPYTGTTDIAFNPAGDIAYIGNAADGRISVVNVSTQAEVTTITIGSEPGSINFSPDGTKALVVFGSGSIGFIDTTTHTISSTLDITTLGYEFPHSAVFSPDGSQVIFSAQDGVDDKVVFLDLASTTVAGAVIVPQGGNNIADMECGNLDVTFGNYGFVTTSFSTEDFTGFGVVSDSSGKIIHPGHCILGDQVCVVRYNADGSLDTSFGTGGKVQLTIGGSSSSANDAHVKDDGKILLAGHCNEGGPGDKNMCLIQLNADGSLDTSFQTNGIADPGLPAGEDSALDLVIDSSGLIYTAGFCENITSGNSDACVMRFTADGSLDTTFSGDGVAEVSICEADTGSTELVVDAGGNVVLAVNCAAAASVTTLARLTSSGDLDTSFGTAGIASENYGTDAGVALTVDIDADGSIFASGACETDLLGDSSICIAKFNQNGALDTSFGANGFSVWNPYGGNVDMSYDLVIDPLGNLIVGGLCDGELLCIARINSSNGMLDLSFDDDGSVFFKVGDGSSRAGALMIDANGDIIFAGSCNDGAGSDDLCLIKYDADPMPTPEPTPTPDHDAPGYTG